MFSSRPYPLVVVGEVIAIMRTRSCSVPGTASSRRLLDCRVTAQLRVRPRREDKRPVQREPRVLSGGLPVLHCGRCGGKVRVVACLVLPDTLLETGEHHLI